MDRTDNLLFIAIRVEEALILILKSSLASSCTGDEKEIFDKNSIS